MNSAFDDHVTSQIGELNFRKDECANYFLFDKLKLKNVLNDWTMDDLKKQLVVKRTSYGITKTNSTKSRYGEASGKMEGKKVFWHRWEAHEK